MIKYFRLVFRMLQYKMCGIKQCALHFFLSMRPLFIDRKRAFFFSASHIFHSNNSRVQKKEHKCSVKMQQTYSLRIFHFNNNSQRNARTRSKKGDRKREVVAYFEIKQLCTRLPSALVFLWLSGLVFYALKYNMQQCNLFFLVE